MSSKGDDTSPSTRIKVGGVDVGGNIYSETYELVGKANSLYRKLCRRKLPIYSLTAHGTNLFYGEEIVGRRIPGLPPMNRSEGEPMERGRRVTNEDLDAKKRRLLQGFSNAGVSRLEAEQVVALYLERRFPTSPPPLPPRPSLLDTASLDSDPSSATVGERRARSILILDTENDPVAALAQGYLELLRIQLAEYGGSWLFHRVGRCAMRQTGMHEDFERMYDAMVNVVLPQNEDYVDSPVSQLAERVHSGCDKLTDPIAWDFARYDYFFTASASTFELLNGFIPYLQSEDPTQPFYRPAGKVPPRAYLIPEFKEQIASSTSEPLQAVIDDFVRRELALRPFHYFKEDGSFQVGFQRFEVTSDNLEFLEECEENAGLSLRYHHCDMHIAKQSENYGYVAAIVGKGKDVEKVQERIGKIMAGGNVIERFSRYTPPEWKGKRTVDFEERMGKDFQ